MPGMLKKFAVFIAAPYNKVSFHRLPLAFSKNYESVHCAIFANRRFSNWSPSTKERSTP
jgi:hypothetical protein